ncbi:MAG TPA: efflux transporter outer membrane subunit [Planctomycetota bacterium]
MKPERKSQIPNPTPQGWVHLGLLLLAGCAVGPDYEEPKTESAGAFRNAEGMSTDPAEIAWWKGFADPKLDDLIARAASGNLGVKAAAALLREARALYGLETYDLFPTVTTRADYTRQMLSKATFLSDVPRDDRVFGYYSAGFDAYWELDFFGRVRRSMEAASAEVGLADATRRDVLLSVLAEIARSWFELKGARNRQAVASRNIANEEEALRLTIARFEAGRGAELDVERARTQLRSTQAALPPIEEDVARARHRLAVLLGTSPHAFDVDTGPPAPPDALPKLIAIGKPEDLLRRRPDIRRAERRLAAATARIGVATADLFPRVTIAGTYGPQAQKLSDLTHAGAAAYSFGPTISWAAFDLGRVAARIRAADARAEADLYAYQETVLRALEETENALTSFGRERARRDALSGAATSAARAAELAETRYQAGAADFLATLDARRTLIVLQLQLADSQTRVMTSLIAVYKALGGGWEIAEPPPRSSP